MLSKEQVKQQMFDKIVEWRQSGLSQKAYCQHNNIVYHVFHYYYHRFRIKEKKEPASFINLQLASDISSPLAHTELIMPDGKRLLFHQGVSVDFLKALIG